ncbi:F-box domain containing protein [Tanacetum coccineum]
MSDHIPLDIQSEIIKKLPIKSLLQFRSVSRQWKSLIDSFGVCYDTSDPKLVKINVVQTPSIRWEVQVFTLSSPVWKTVYIGAPFKSCDLVWGQSERFGEVCLPERLVRTHDLWVAKMNESLGLLEYYDEGEMSVCGVWMRKDGENKLFTKIYTVKVEGELVFNMVLGFMNNGEVVMEMEDDDFVESQIEVYEPSSGRLNSVGISGKYATFSVMSYMETLLLLHQSNSIIH